MIVTVAHIAIQSKKMLEKIFFYFSLLFSIFGLKWIIVPSPVRSKFAAVTPGSYQNNHEYFNALFLDEKLDIVNYYEFFCFPIKCDSKCIGLEGTFGDELINFGIIKQDRDYGHGRQSCKV